MLSDSIKQIYQEAQDLSKFLIKKNEISFSSSVKDLYSKTLLLSIASYFESELTKIVLEHVKEVAGHGSLVAELVKSKAINRQYHTWFEWGGKNANSFFALFGENFKKYANKCVEDDSQLEQSIKHFLSLGADRNRLVHKDYANFSLDKTSDEIYKNYESACYFIEWFIKAIKAYSPTHHLDNR